MSVYGHAYIVNTEVEYRLERAGVGRGNPGLGGRGAWAGTRSGFLARRRAKNQTAAAAGAAAAAAPASPLPPPRHWPRQIFVTGAANEGPRAWSPPWSWG
ncbi:hypothetical protein ACF3NS_12460 [Arsenicicoccus cauae]|uniref:hypothetical protein n=1 Tax=Arsenicicoccus cauae TaxID=2663847 RepID=UPI00370D663D